MKCMISNKTLKEECIIMKKMKIINRIVSRNEASKMYDKGCLPTFIITKGKDLTDSLDLLIINSVGFMSL